jgi:membrane peptidoglycan carboxypeptidase
MRRIRKTIRIFLKTWFIMFVIAFLALVTFLGIKYLPIYSEYRKEAIALIVNSSSKDFILNETSYIYDDNGKVLAKLKTDTDSEYLSYEQIPQDVVNAFVAIEDRSFWTNKGYDMKGIARVVYYAIKTGGEEVHGASTITQQLARLTYLSQEVSLDRKIREIEIAKEMTKAYSKEDIMEFYCNDVYFANGYYGISAAAKGYFNKNVDDLSLAEIAYLCAIPNRPTYYNPYTNKSNALSRQRKILEDMLELGYITEYDYNNAMAEDIVLAEQQTITYNYQTSYAIECSIRYLMKLNNFEFKYHFDTNDEYQTYLDGYNEAYDEAKKELYSGGYRIYTSLNSDIQDLLQSTIDETLSFNKELESDGSLALQGASTIIDNTTRKVIAIVGGRTEDGNELGLNRAYQSYRQPGSTMKPLVVYTPALENGYTQSSIVQNISVSTANTLYEQNKMSAILDLTGDTMSLKSAVENSKNGCAYYVFSRIGISNGLSKLESMNFKKITYQDYNIATALGGLTYGATTEEMCNAYSTLANDGSFVEATCITSFLSDNGEELYREAAPTQVYDVDATRKMTSILQGVITNGTAKSMGWSSKMPVAGKTGTTNNSKDGWFCGYSPYYTMSVWVGYDTPKEVSGLYGSTYPCQIWKNVMEELNADKDIISFASPSMTPSTGDEKYLPGRSDDEELSNGYTVGDYRNDYAIVEEVNTICNQILSTYDTNTINSLYQQGVDKIHTIYGSTAASNAEANLSNAYNTQMNNINMLMLQQSNMQ